jgi:hypothetical protein
VARWSSLSSFKITLDGCTVSGINYDGEYIIIVGNSWDDRDWDDLIDKLYNGNLGLGGFAHAIPLEMGKSETDLRAALTVSHSSGLITIKSANTGEKTILKIENTENLYTYGWQTLSRISTILESEYTPTTTYSITVEISGDGGTNYEITSPTSGNWTLSDVASALNSALPVSACCGIDKDGKIRITEVNGGNQSTIDISSGTTGTDLLTIIGPADIAVDGSSGYISCLGNVNATLGIESQTVTGTPDTPILSEKEELYNYTNEIPAKYNEILYISKDYYNGETAIKSNQKHGIIFTYEELR